MVSRPESPSTTEAGADPRAVTQLGNAAGALVDIPSGGEELTRKGGLARKSCESRARQ
jgi:hypothetical protein